MESDDEGDTEDTSSGLQTGEMVGIILACLIIGFIVGVCASKYQDQKKKKKTVEQKQQEIKPHPAKEILGGGMEKGRGDGLRPSYMAVCIHAS